MRVVALISGGKDSCYNMMKCVAAGHQIVALANLQPAVEDELDSFMFQTVGHEGVHLYAEAMGLPLYQTTTHGVSVTREMNYDPREGDEVEELYELLKKVVKDVEGGVEGVASGAILSDYQRLRVENVCGRLGLVSLAYLWRQEQKELLKEMIDSGLKAIVIKVAVMGLTPDRHLGMTLEELYPEVCSLNERFPINICGEGGEYETFTLDCPLFKKEIILQNSEIVMHSADAFAPVAFLKMTKLELQDKEVSGQNNCKLLKCFFSDIHKDEFVPTDYQSRCLFNGSSMWLAWNGDPCILSALDQARLMFEDIGMSLLQMNCDWKDVVLVYLYLRDMASYKEINEVYSMYFLVDPPARVCVSLALPIAVHMRVEMLICKRGKDEEGVVDDRRSMHVQSHSEWAPANIGPYSQAYMVGDMVLLAGQIGLDPVYMTLVSPLDQASLSLHHVKSVLRACQASLSSVLFGVCYYTTEQAGWTARSTLKCDNGGREIHPVVFIRVSSLPKEACVEWHFVAVKSSRAVSCICVSYSDTSPSLQIPHYISFIMCT